MEERRQSDFAHLLPLSASPFSISVRDKKEKNRLCVICWLCGRRNHYREAWGCRVMRLISALEKPSLTSASSSPSACGRWDCATARTSRHDFSFLIIQGLYQGAKQHVSAPAPCPVADPALATTLLPAENQILTFAHPWLLPHTEETQCV